MISPESLNIQRVLIIEYLSCDIDIPGNFYHRRIRIIEINSVIDIRIGGLVESGLVVAVGDSHIMQRLVSWGRTFAGVIGAEVVHQFGLAVVPMVIRSQVGGLFVSRAIVARAETHEFRHVSAIMSLHTQHEVAAGVDMVFSPSLYYIL